MPTDGLLQPLQEPRHTHSPQNASQSKAGACPQELPSWHGQHFLMAVILPLSSCFSSPEVRELLAGCGSLLGLGCRQDAAVLVQ